MWRAKASHSTPSASPSARTTTSEGVAAILASASVREVPVWLTGIGTVQASNTVTVRPRVSGTLDEVTFVEGAMVKEGDVLARIDPRPYRAALAQARAKKAQDDAELTNARLELTRVQALVKNRAVSQQSLDQAEAAVGRLTALVEADQAALEAAQLDMDFTTVRAPISGRTGVRLVDAGNVVTASQDAGLVVVSQLKPVAVLFTLPQTHLTALRKHMQPGAPPLKAEAINENGEILDEGRLELIDNQIDSATGTLRLKATFPNARLSLWPGQFVSARVLVETLENAVVVPSEAVKPGLDGPYAYVVKDNSTVEPRTLTLGMNFDGMTVIQSGLTAGERVVREGQSKLKPGARINEASPALAAEPKAEKVAETGSPAQAQAKPHGTTKGEGVVP